MRRSQVHDGAGGITLVSNGTVKANAKPGTYPVSYLCGTIKVTAHLKVVAPGSEPYAAIGIQDWEIHAGQEVLVVASCQDPAFTSRRFPRRC